MQRTLIGLAAVAALAVSGCGSAPGTGTPAGADVITVRMTDFALSLDLSKLGPGTHTFHAVNAGAKPHSIEVDGPGVSDQRISGTVAPGQSGDLTVTLQDGTYDMYCPVGNHRAMGMETRFTVGGATQAPAVNGGSSGGY